MAPTAVALLQAVLSRLHALAVSPEESVPRTQGARMAVRVLGRVLFRDGRSGPACAGRRVRGGAGRARTRRRGRPPPAPPRARRPPPPGAPRPGFPAWVCFGGGRCFSPPASGDW